MKTMNSSVMKNVNGGWYFGKLTCPYCGRKLEATLLQRIAYSKTVLENFGYAAHGYNIAFGTKLSH